MKAGLATFHRIYRKKELTLRLHTLGRGWRRRLWLAPNARVISAIQHMDAHAKKLEVTQKWLAPNAYGFHWESLRTVQLLLVMLVVAQRSKTESGDGTSVISAIQHMDAHAKKLSPSARRTAKATKITNQHAKGRNVMCREDQQYLQRRTGWSTAQTSAAGHGFRRNYAKLY